jgi:hypothetical protein
MLNWKGFERKTSWPNFKVLSQHSLEGSEENQAKRQSGYPVYGPRLDPEPRLTRDWTSGRQVYDPRQRQRIFPLVSVSSPALRPTQPPIQWVLGVLSLRSRGMTLTVHPHLTPRSRMSRSCTSSSPCRLHDGSGTALLYYLPPECEAGVSSNRPRRSVIFVIRT